MFRSPSSGRRRTLARLAGAVALAWLVAAGASARDVSVTARAVVRSRPEPLAPVLAIVQPTGIVTLQETLPGWVRVATRDGQVGYVAGRIAGQSLAPDERSAMPGRDIPHALRTALATDLHASPAAGSAVTASILPGTEVTVVHRMGDWLQVEAGEAAGWLDLLASPVDTEPGRVPRVAEAAPASDAAPAPAAAPAQDEASARRAQLRAEREAREAAEKAEREQRAAEQRASREKEAKPAGEDATPAPAAAPAQDEAAARRAQLRADREAREAAAKAERVQRAAERASREKEPKPAGEDATPAPAAAPAQDEASARRAQLRADREAREAAAKAEREQRAAEQRASREKEAKPAGEDATPAPAAAPAQDEAAARRAQLRADREAREAAAKAEREAAAQKEREARAAEQARVQQPAPAVAAAPQDDEARAAREKAEADAKAQREAEARQRAEAEAQRKAQAEQQRQAREAERQAREAERAAQAERDKLEKERIEQAQREAEEREKTRVPPPPVDIPPAVPVAVEAKAPSERKRDPQTNPLVREGMPPSGPAPQGPAPAAHPAPAGFQAFDTNAQIERSVASLHEDRAHALDLSTGEAAPVRAPSSYVGDDARTVSTTVVSQIVARVNDEIVTNSEFERRLQEMLDEGRRTGRGTLTPPEEQEVRRRLLIRLIEQMLLVEEAKALGLPFDKVYENAKQVFMKQAGIKDDLELVQLLDATGRTWDDFRRELLRESVPRIVLKNQVYGNVTVPEEDVEAHYRLHQEDWSEEPCVRIREIVLQPDPKERSKDFNARLEGMLTALESGADFCDVAHRYSKAASKDDCGLLPQCFTRGQLDEKVALVAFRMKPGDVEPITTEWGYHVIRLEELKPRHMRPLSEVRDQIVDKLRTERTSDQMRRYVDKLRESAKIELAPGYRELLEGNTTARGGGQ